MWVPDPEEKATRRHLSLLGPNISPFCFCMHDFCLRSPAAGLQAYPSLGNHTALVYPLSWVALRPPLVLPVIEYHACMGVWSLTWRGLFLQGIPSAIGRETIDGAPRRTRRHGWPVSGIEHGRS